MSNLALWDKVKKTDPDFTKRVDFGRSFTSISPQYQIREATNLFGPYGSGWGFESCEMDFSQAENIGLVLVKAVFFYILEDKRNSFPINNSWPIRSSNKPDAKIDPDFIKKAETNTMSKALSKLGFSADVFMGEFDDPDYVKSIADEFALEQAEDKIEEALRQQEEYESWASNVIHLIETSVSENELRKVFTGAIRKANLYKDKDLVIKFTKAKDAKKGDFENVSTSV
jgi:hypothetical protein